MAAFVVYGPQTTLVLALAGRVDIFILDRGSGQFLLIRKGVQVAPDTPEFAINASNRRHWHGPVRAYIDECLAGISVGDRLYATLTPNGGFRLTPHDPDFQKAMEVARRGMKRYHNALAELPK